MISPWSWAVGGCALAAVLANGLALTAFCARPALRTVADRFVANLLAGNLACAAVLGPLLAFDLTASGRPSPWACAAAEGVSAFFCLAASSGALLVAADQYLAVTDPLRYRARVNGPRCLSAVLAQWTVSALFGAGAALASAPSSGPWGFCETSTAPRGLYDAVFSCLYVGCSLSSFASVCLMRARIWLAARRSFRPPAPSPIRPACVSPPTFKIDLVADDCLRSVRSSPELGGLLHSPSPAASPRPSPASSLRWRVSNESRAARAGGLAAALAASQLPAAVSRLFPRLGVLPLAMLCLGAAASPFLFAFRSRRVRRELSEMCGAREAIGRDWPPKTALLVTRALAARKARRLLKRSPLRDRRRRRSSTAASSDDAG